jgi:hypothetical protein
VKFLNSGEEARGLDELSTGTLLNSILHPVGKCSKINHISADNRIIRAHTACIQELTKKTTGNLVTSIVAERLGRLCSKM